jgi:glycosyltransferase involved in cell wall biosynthesis
MRFSVLIATYNRAAELRDTLQNIKGLSPAAEWEVIVIDNNSTDETPQVVAEAARTFPVELRYLFEPQQGRSAALNAGISAARGEILATTDDDVRVPPDWLTAAENALESLDCDYVGGKVLPLWPAEPPAWIPNHGGKQWAVLALLDYGPEPVPFFKYAHRVPIGVNMAFRRDAFRRAGPWSNRIGRKKGTLLGQEVREWTLRARRAGLRGSYAPAMVVQHLIPRERLKKAYFRRWFYWNGVSRALLYRDAWIDMQAPEETSLDFSNVPHILGVPRFFYGMVPREMWRMVKTAWSGHADESFDAELWLWFFLGVLHQRWRDRKLPRPDASVRTLPTPAIGES